MMAVLKEQIMERKDDIIDLGAASTETKGGTGVVLDFISGRGAAALSDD